MKAEEIFEEELLKDFMLVISNANSKIPYDAPNTRFWFNILTCMTI